jgi:hypothetical protein
LDGDETCYAANSTLLGHAIAVTRWCEAPGTMALQPSVHVEMATGRRVCEHQRRAALGWSGRVITRESLVNAVRYDKPKVLTGLDQKVRSPVQGGRHSLSRSTRLPAERGDLPHSGKAVEQGKPHVLPWGRGAVRHSDGTGGTGGGSKRRLRGNDADKG